MGKLDGLPVSVADASKLVGKKVKVRVERVLNGTAYATLVQAATAKVDAPITAESEAEKPTRAVRRKTGENAEALAPAIEKAKEQAAEAPEETGRGGRRRGASDRGARCRGEARRGRSAAEEANQARLTRRPQPAQEAGGSSRSRERRASRGAGAEA